MDFKRQLKAGFPSVREIITLVAALAVWMGVTAVFVGIRPEHWLMTLLLVILFFPVLLHVSWQLPYCRLSFLPYRMTGCVSCLTMRLIRLM